jgi:GT2 family glycosyltransferase
MAPLPASHAENRVSVVVPTYRRPGSLRACLAALHDQGDRADEVVVVHRGDDQGSADVAQAAGVRRQVVGEPGVIAAMTRGAAAAGGEVIAFCDDDAAPRADWIARIRAAFRDPRVGAFGGRDVLAPPHPVYPPSDVAGTIGRWGRLTGEHHRAVGSPRDVAVLKGVNMAFRASALRFPEGLRGRGAQVHFEVAMCLWARTQGWGVRFDPDLLVDHDPGARHDSDRRGRPAARAVSDASYNLTFTLLSLRPDLRLRRPAYGLVIGDKSAPGAVRAAVAIARREHDIPRRLGPSLHGQLAAVARVCAGSRIAMVTAEEWGA